MPDEIHAIPLAEIASSLLRDRTSIHPDDYEELRASILKHGLRLPIEVYPITEPTEDEAEQGARYGLISGYRRFTAFQDLDTNFVPGKFATIPAIIRNVTSEAEAIRLMVEENELHAAITPWEKGAVLIEACTDHIFATLDDAIAALFPTANATKRSRLRAYATVYREMFDRLKEPETISYRQMVRLAAALREGWGEVISRHLGMVTADSAADQWRVIDPLLAEFERDMVAKGPDLRPRPGRPIRFRIVRKGLQIRREMTKDGYALHFGGREVTSDVMDDLVERIQEWFGHPA